MITKKSKISMFFALPLFLVALFYACSDNSTLTIVPETGSTISFDEKIIITFPDSMDPETLELTGNMAAWADGGVWSEDNKVLTISAADYWDLALHTLNVGASNSDGEAGDLIELDYTVEFPTFTKFQKADVVIGQSNFEGVDCNQGGAVGRKTLCGPYGNASFGHGKLVLGDHQNDRALLFDGIPTSNNASAEFVIDQENFTSTGQGLGRDQNGGGFLTSQTYNGKLFVSDPENSRIKVFNTFPASNGPNASFVIGQNDFTTDVDNCSRSHLTYFESFLVADGKLIVADSGNNRVLIWNKVPTESGVKPDLVLGQNSFDTCAQSDNNQDGMDDGQPSNRTLDYPTGIWTDGKKLIISEWDGNRVMIWNTFPTESFARADVVLGQYNFSRYTRNDDDQDGVDDGQPSDQTLAEPTYGIISNGEKLLITDSGNHRILIWNTFPKSNFARADVVLGQNSFARNTGNDDNQDGVDDGQASDRTFQYPMGATLVGNKLVVTDQSNNRYLVFTGE